MKTIDVFTESIFIKKNQDRLELAEKQMYVCIGRGEGGVHVFDYVLTFIIHFPSFYLWGSLWISMCQW
jgi:hypothetical protein